MLIHKLRKIVTVVSGGGSTGTLKFSGVLLNQIILSATSTTNVFDFNVVDEDGDTVYTLEAVEGGMSEHSIYLPLRGAYTLSISAASIDEDILIKLLIEE